MTLGIVTALPGELATLTRQRLVPGEWKPLREDLLVALAGIGPERAARAGAGLVGQGATALLSWGTAAALSPGLAAGSLILPRRVIGADGTAYLADAPWHQRLLDCLSGRLEVHTGALAESRVVLSEPEAKLRLGQAAQAEAADMESAALAELAQVRGIPFCVIRTIVDPVDVSVPRCILHAIGGRGEVRTRALVARALCHPGDWRRLAELGRHFRQAQKTLARVIALTGLGGLVP